MTLPNGNYGVKIDKFRLVVQESQHFLEMNTKVGKQLLSLRIPINSVRWKKEKKKGEKEYA